MSDLSEISSNLNPILASPGALHERQRIYLLARSKLLDTPPSEAFDQITRLASQMFDAPIALVSLVDSDRQWF